MENVMSKQLKGKMYNESGEEGPIAKSIEKQTAKISSDVFLWAAASAIAGSLTLRIAGRKHAALFVGQWTAPLLLLGLYNKLVKVAGHDQKDREPTNQEGPDNEQDMD